MNMDPEKTDKAPAALLSVVKALSEIKRDQLSGDAAGVRFLSIASKPLLDASKCPDFVLDRGHWFGEALEEDDKIDLKAFLKSL